MLGACASGKCHPISGLDAGVNVPGEVWLCRGLALLARDLRKAHLAVRVSKQHFRFVVKVDCDIVGTPLRLG